jgi:hypothetical protein
MEKRSERERAMKTPKGLARAVLLPLAAVLLLAAVAGGKARAQQAAASAKTVSVKASLSELANVKITNRHTHISYRPGWARPHAPIPSSLPAAESLLIAPEINTVPAPGVFPSDVSKGTSTGKVVTTAQAHAVFVNCPTFGCWGSPDPRTFLTKLDSSVLIHVTDQYSGMTSNGRYTVGTTVAATYPIFTTLGDNDILAIVHAAAAQTKLSGYNHIYHVFLPKNVDVCFTGMSQCYSPDMPTLFAFCAYHESVTFNDTVGHVLLTVQPFAGPYGSGIPDCTVVQPSPNGAIVDSQANLLSHEEIETITDPDPPLTWVASQTVAVFGLEIGDLCLQVDPNSASYASPVQNVGGTKYRVQTEYSNVYHACAGQP